MNAEQVNAQVLDHLNKTIPKNDYLQDDRTDLSPFQSPLGNLLRAMFSDVERDRREIEQEWLKDLRQYKGRYDPEVLAKMHAKRSQAFLSITRTKVRTVDSRMADILFPANGDRNWSIAPTPVPDLDPNLEMSVAQQMTEITGKTPSQPEIRNILFDEAKRRSDSMQKEIADQLAEIKYREIIRKVLHSGNLYGTGVLKGPLVKRQTVKRWVPNGMNGQWGTISMERLTPFCEFVPIWDVYPDMSVDDKDNAQFVFQRHVMPRHKLLGLTRRPGFNGQAIQSYIKANPSGDSDIKNHENDLTDLSQDGSTRNATHASRKNKYEVLEFWGFLSTEQLRAEGVNLESAPDDLEVVANVWLVGDVVIKAVLSPIEGADLPYYFYYFEKDETSIFGEGIPRIMRDPQKLFNAAVRATLDNAATAAGPYIEANMDLLEPDEDPTDLYPFRVFQRRGSGVEAQAKAINVYDIPSHTAEFMGLVEFFLNSADEVTTIPRYMYGDTNNIGGAGKTATGLSMMMGSANITIKDQIKNFDDGITKQFIKAMYFWNMDFNPKTEIKGDFNVQAEGSTSLVAKEVVTEQLNMWLNITNNPVDLQLTNRSAGLREAAKAMDLGEYNLVKNDDQIAFEQEEASRRAEAERREVMEIERLKAKSSGHVDDQDRSNRPSMEQVPLDKVEQGRIPEVTTPDGQTL